MHTQDLILRAHHAAADLAMLSDDVINAVLASTAAALRANYVKILDANQCDLNRMDPKNPKYDRLLLTRERIEAIADDMEHVATLSTPLGRVYSSKQRPNGMTISKVSVPFGVVGVIYEARPNVTADVFALCLKSGNVCVLKGGSDAATVVMEGLKMIAIVTHVADVRSCVLHPASTTHRQLTDRQLVEAGISAGLIRLSVGIENAEDIIDDIKQALEKI